MRIYFFRRAILAAQVSSTLDLSIWNQLLHQTVHSFNNHIENQRDRKQYCKNDGGKNSKLKIQLFCPKTVFFRHAKLQITLGCPLGGTVTERVDVLNG